MGSDDRRNFTDARLDDDFAENLIGNDALDCARKLIADALFHIAELKDDLQAQ